MQSINLFRLIKGVISFYSIVSMKLDNIIAFTFNDIPLHIRSSFKAHSKRFYSMFS